MEQLTMMYPGIHGSVPTRLTEELSATGTAIPIEDVSVLPPAPNIMTISAEDHAEVIRYGKIDGKILRECVRGFAGTTAQIWPSGTACYRAYTAYDHQVFIENVQKLEAATSDLAAKKQDADALAEGAFASFGTAPGSIARGNHTHSNYLAQEVDPTVPAWAKAAEKPAYTADEVGAASADHTHSGYLAKEVDPTVPAWAKAAQKPAYTAAEVGAVRLVDGKADAEQICAPILRVSASRSLTRDDAGKLLEVSSAGESYLWIPRDDYLNLPIGTEIEIMQEGEGAVKIDADESVTLHSLDGLRKTAGRYAMMSLKKHGANSWRLAGALR